MSINGHEAQVIHEAGFQPEGTAWAPDRPGIVDLLQRARHVEMRNIFYGSNSCYLVLLDAGDDGCSLAVYKPSRGEYPLWDFPQGTLYRREVASYDVDYLLGWGLVPPTVAASGRYGAGSLQLFIEESREEAVHVDQLRKLALLDCVLNNADRKAEHLLVGSPSHLWGIDHGLTFHVQPKLRTVLWHFAGEPIPDGDLSDLSRLREEIGRREGRALRNLLEPREVRALAARVDSLIANRVFPDPRHKAIPYRW